MNTRSVVKTPHGIAYARRLCKHFAHKIQASVEGSRGEIRFPFGVCTIECDENKMDIRVDVESPDDVDRAERVVGDHLIRMANKDDPVVSWVREAG